jgi:ferredoxin-NADP reductase
VVLRLEVDDRVVHVPGQHYVVRLTADDGYTASRSYSVASAPTDPLVELYVERLVDGEVSGFLADVVAVGDELEVRGPIGGWFAWDGVTPALAIGGGTGVVPLISMLRHSRVVGHPDRVCLVAAGRTFTDLPYAAEITGGCDVVALSREPSPAGRPAGRLGADDLLPHLREGQVAFVCGSAAFAEATSQLLVSLGVAAADIRVERFGPSG